MSAPLSLHHRLASRWARAREALGTSFWAVPALCMGAAVGLSVGAETLDARLPSDAQAWYLFRGGPSGARSVLETVAASMMTFTGLVFSVTILVLQQASNQFSPRVLRTFLSDRASQLALGTFVGAFVYALLSLRHVRGTSEDVELRVPSLTVWLAIVLALACVAAFIGYIHHVAQSIRAVRVLRRIGDETRRSLERLYPEGLGSDEGEGAEAARPAAPAQLVVPSPHASGVLVSVDEARLWHCVTHADVTAALLPAAGDFVPQGAPLFEVWGDPGRLDVRALAACVRTGEERTLHQDAAFGLRELVDVAERALSPGINDPTTAVQALDQVHDVLRRLARRRLPSPARLDGVGRVRLWLPRPGWEDFVHLGLDEVRRSGEASLQVARRLRALLQDLLAVAPPSRQGPVRRQLRLLDAALARGFPGRAERGRARGASAQGQGPQEGRARRGRPSDG